MKQFHYLYSASVEYDKDYYYYFALPLSLPNDAWKSQAATSPVGAFKQKKNPKQKNYNKVSSYFAAINANPEGPGRDQAVEFTFPKDNKTFPFFLSESLSLPVHILGNLLLLGIHSLFFSWGIKLLLLRLVIFLLPFHSFSFVNFRVRTFFPFSRFNFNSNAHPLRLEHHC